MAKAAPNPPFHIAGMSPSRRRERNPRPGLRVILLSFLLWTIPWIAQADVVLDWNALALDCIRHDTTSPTLSSRNLAILHTAIYDAVNSITGTHQPYLWRFAVPTNTSLEAAAVSAAYEVLIALYPSFEPWADDLYDAWFDSSIRNAALTNGLIHGLQVGWLALNSRSNDGATTEVPYIPSSQTGQWARTPPFFRPPLTPQWGVVDTFCLPSVVPFLPVPPPSLDSPEYAAAVNEVKSIGGVSSAVRTAEQSEVAIFWSDFSYTAMPPGHWHEIAAAIGRSRLNTLEENARLFALISLAQADAAIVCWEAKFRYNLWRPITAIRRADEDGNSATERDGNWDDFLNAPPFPAYTSGHSTFSKASAEVIAAFYGTDAILFTASSDSLPGVFRTFTSLAACADEVGLSRIYGGIHFPFDNTSGKSCGQTIGAYVNANFLLPNRDLPLVRIEGFSNGVPQIRIQGHIGFKCVLQISADLIRWQPIFTNTAVSGGFMAQDTSGANSSKRFYRVAEYQ